MQKSVMSQNMANPPMLPNLPVFIYSSENFLISNFFKPTDLPILLHIHISKASNSSEYRPCCCCTLTRDRQEVKNVFFSANSRRLGRCARELYSAARKEKDRDHRLLVRRGITSGVCCRCMQQRHRGSSVVGTPA